MPSEREARIVPHSIPHCTTIKECTCNVLIAVCGAALLEYVAARNLSGLVVYQYGSIQVPVESVTALYQF